MHPVMQALLADTNTQYCCYCCEPQGDKWHCCQENHFVPFSDLYSEDQQAIFEEQL